MLRVTGGDLLGFKLEVPRDSRVRPPLEMARQAVFNILGQDLTGFRVLDVFAGSGVMGIEALSRGAERAVFVEKDRAAAKIIAGNLEKTKMTDSARIVSADAFYPRRYLTGESGIDVCFLDPPFNMMRTKSQCSRVAALVDALFESESLLPGACVLLRIPTRSAMEPEPESARLSDDRTYGNSRVLFFSRTDEES